MWSQGAPGHLLEVEDFVGDRPEELATLRLLGLRLERRIL